MTPDESDMVDVLLEVMHDTYDLATVHGADAILHELDAAREYEREVACVIRRHRKKLGIGDDRGLMTAVIERAAWGI